MAISKLVYKASKVFGVLLAAFLSLCLFTILKSTRSSWKAERFSDSITIGESVATVVGRAKRDGKIIVIEDAPGGPVFVFPGFVFSRAACRVKAANGVVVSKSWRPASD
jgi:hypothetical protein